MMGDEGNNFNDIETLELNDLGSTIIEAIDGHRTNVALAALCCATVDAIFCMTEIHDKSMSHRLAKIVLRNFSKQMRRELSEKYDRLPSVTKRH